MGPAIEASLFLLMITLAIVIARLRSLFAAAMLFGIFSLLAAGMQTLMDAVDVAFTEAAVGAGISTVLFLGALGLTTSTETRPLQHRVSALVVVTATGLLLAYGTLDMPAYGDPDAPIHTHVAPHYLRDSTAEIGIPNVVTSVLASYRGYDTFGETTVVLTAAVGAILLLGGIMTRESEAAIGDDALVQDGAATDAGVPTDPTEEGAASDEPVAERDDASPDENEVTA
ncbi:MAG: DUF4040 domain-containing protein [Myxococcota bacterium]